MPANDRSHRRPGTSAVISNNDIIYLWWSLPEKITDCLGFSIHRIIDGKEESKGLRATVGFGVATDNRKSPQTTDEWPIQSFNWKDLYAPHNKDISYRIIPMIGPWDNLEPDDANAITTGTVRRTQKYGDLTVIFNRGLLSTQAFSKRGGVEGVAKREDAKKILENPSNEWRKRLGGQMLFTVNKFFEDARAGGGKCYAALYELTDKKLVEELAGMPDIEIILSNANGSKTQTVDGKKKTISVNDGTNKKTRTALKKLMREGKLKVYDRMLGTHIGHNKFVVYVDSQDVPRLVLTGSTNWTATGLCGQTNNMIVIDSKDIAYRYMEYWREMEKDKKQEAAFRKWCAKKGKEYVFDNGNSRINIWYSPNTVKKNKPSKDADCPVDIQTVFDLIGKAKKSILFLVFNPGSPSIIEEIKKVTEERKQAGDEPLFVRGAISDAKIAKKVTTEIFSRSMDEKPDRYIVTTGVAAIPGPFSYFEQELLKIGFATIHDKVLVIDPFEKDCVVVTGSHNLGFKASYTNDENMVIIQGNRPVAQAYAAHVLDVVNHFKWRYKLQEKVSKAGAKTPKEKEKVLKKEWNDLNEEDKWMDPYFKSGSFKSADKLFLPEHSITN